VVQHVRGDHRVDDRDQRRLTIRRDVEAEEDNGVRDDADDDCAD